jgi:hypothetical protein
MALQHPFITGLPFDPNYVPIADFNQNEGANASITQYVI